MHALLVFVLAIAMSITGIPSIWAAPSSSQEGGSISGRAQDESGNPIRNQDVRLRNLDSGRVVDLSKTDDDGMFHFTGVAPGNYVVELVDGNRLVGASLPVASGIAPAAGTAGVAAGATGVAAGTVSVTGVIVTVSSSTAAALAAGGGLLSFFATVPGALILAGAGAALTAAVVTASGAR